MDDIKLDRAVEAEIKAAITAYQKVSESMWPFFEKCAAVVGRRIPEATKKLAAGILRTEDTVEGYAAAWSLWLDLLKRYPSQSELFRDSLTASHFVVVGRKYKRRWLSLDESANLLALAMRDNLSVEQLRAKLPVLGGGDWNTSVRGAVAFLEKKIINAPRLGANTKVSPVVVRAAKVFVSISKRELAAQKRK